MAVVQIQSGGQVVRRRARYRSVLGLLAVSAALVAALPALASAATISGNVKEAAPPQLPLEGVRVCARPQTIPLDDCATTDALGNYSIWVAPGQFAVYFDDTERNRNVVSQYYGANPFPPGTLVTLAGPGDSATGIDAQLQPGSTIEGTVTEAINEVTIAGTPVCAEAQTPTGSYGRCVHSGADGTYRINGLAPGSYSVEFQTGSLNYQPQRYQEPIEILGPGEKHSGIDAAMKVGVAISGRLTEAATGWPVEMMNVDLFRVGSEASVSTLTDGGGEYEFRGLPEADYVLLFSRPAPSGADDCFAPEYYNDSSNREGATVLHGVPGIPITGIDAALANVCRGAPPLQVTFTPSSSAKVGAVGKPVRCRKGTHRKRVKGKVRCVKRHKHRKRHRGQKGHHGPTAHTRAR